MKKILQILATFCCCLFMAYNASATHLMGGNLSYTFLGQTGSNYNYEVTLKMYRYCASGSSGLPNNMNLGIYEEDTLNPNADKNLVNSVVMPLISQQFINPQSSDTSCHFSTVVCVEEGVYQTTISVPSTIGGYHLIADRCCRNNNIANLDNPGNAGQAYYAFIPPTNIVNNAPTFAVPPLPFLCQSDTVSILNAASDIDGDLLTYHFVVPYNGISDGGNPNPNPPATYPWPIPTITYATGAANYSVTLPFGNGGYASIDSTTGLASYYAPNTGYYVVAVEIREYRNGVLIGITRRDLQIIVIVCPSNPPPILASGSGQTTYTILEGQNICFNTAFSDPNGDSLFLTSTGDVFNSLLTNPPATLSNAFGDSTLTSQFCWTTGCNQGRNTPYQFSVIVNDNGCPAKTTNVVYTINVINTPKPASMTGADTLCSNELIGSAFHVPPAAGYTFNWTITNGTQITGGHTNNITVDFSGTGNGIVQVVTVNPYGCPSDTLTKYIYVSSAPVADAGIDVAFCTGFSAGLGASPTSGITYSWSPTTGLSNSSASNPTVTLTNATANPIVIDYIITTNAIGCANTDTVKVTVNPGATANAGSNVATCSNTAVQLGSIPTAGYAYIWNPTNGLSNSTIANPLLTLTNGTLVPDTFYYSLIVQNSYTCKDSDTVRVVISPVPTADAGTDTTYCSGQSAVIGSGTTTGYTYSWLPTTGLSSTTTSSTTVSATNATQSLLTINYAVVTTWFGCRDTDSVAVNIKPIPISNAGPNTLLCSNNSVTLGTTFTTGYTYVWSPSTGLSNINISNPLLILTNTDTIPDTLLYYVTTTLNGCTSSDTVRVVSAPVPVADAGSDVTFCSGQTVPIGTSSVSGYNYNWSPATGISNTTSSNPNLTLTNATTAVDTVPIILTVTWFGCPDRDTISAFVKPLPVSEAGVNQSLCNGDTATLGTSATTGYTYAWTPSTLLSNSTISNPILIVSNAGPGIDTLHYNVTTTLNGCTSTDSTTLFVNPLPDVQATAAPTAICLGSSTTLTGINASTYNWATLSNPSVSIGTGTSISVSPITSTSYIVTGTSSATCVNKDTVAVTVNPLPTVAITSANDTICNGDTLLLNATGSATSFNWYVSGNATVIGTGNNILVFPTANTTYVLQGTDGNTCQNNDTVTIAVSPAATISGITGTTSLCPGVVGVSYWVNNPNNASTYQWTISNGSLSSGQGNDSALVDWPNAGAGSVTVIETTNLGCRSHPIVLPVTVNTLLTPTAAIGPQTLCANQATGIVYTTLLTAGSHYTWHVSGGNVTSTNPDITGTATINWTLTGPATGYVWYEENDTTASSVCYGVSDSIAVIINPIPVTSAIQGTNSICVFDTASYTVTNTSGNTYQWTVTGGTIISGTGTNTINVVWNTSGGGSVSVTETITLTTCSGTPVTQNITVNALPVIQVTATPTAICNGDTTQLLATALGSSSFSWSPSTGLSNAGIGNPLANPTSNTTYTVLVTDVNGCKNNNNITVNVNNLPVPDAGATTGICIGNSTTLQASATGSSPYSYSWSPSTGLNATNVSNPTANPTATTLYTVVVTDNNNCKASDTVTVFVNPLPVAVAGTAGGIICNGGTVQLSANGGFSGYLWSPAGSLNNAGIQNPIANPTGLTTYTVVVTDVNGCTDDDTVVVDVNAQPVASFEIDSILSKGATCNGVQVDFLNTSINAINYQWYFGDGASSTDVNPSHLYNFSQGGTIMLIAFNNQCSDTATLANPVLSLADYVNNTPNVFTPNGDNINDCFRLGKDGAFDECSEMKIFNRWGKLVYETDGTHKCWNGKNKSTGTDEPEGTYFYVLKVKDFQVKGSVKLIRK